jgi:hypothetical protein
VSIVPLLDGWRFREAGWQLVLPRVRSRHREAGGVVVMNTDNIRTRAEERIRWSAVTGDGDGLAGDVLELCAEIERLELERQQAENNCINCDTSKSAEIERLNGLLAEAADRIECTNKSFTVAVDCYVDETQRLNAEIERLNALLEIAHCNTRYWAKLALDVTAGDP